MASATQTDSRYGSLAETPKALWTSLTARYLAFRSYRRTLAELRSLSARELSDLGLNQSMIKRVAMEAVYDA